MSEEVKMRLQPLLEDEQADVLKVKHQLPRRRRRGRIIALVIVLLVILIASGVIFYMRRANQPVVRFTQAAVTTGNITVQVSATGPVTPNAEYDMNFLTTGQVKAIDVQVGQQVKNALAQLQSAQNNLTDAAQNATLTAPVAATVAAIKWLDRRNRRNRF